jgi:hypothetical protein
MSYYLVVNDINISNTWHQRIKLSDKIGIKNQLNNHNHFEQPNFGSMSLLIKIGKSQVGITGYDDVPWPP